MSEEQKVMEVDIAAFCKIRNELAAKARTAKEFELRTIIKDYIRELDKLLFHYGAVAPLTQEPG